MRKILLNIFFIIGSCRISAQQFPQYTQFIFNKIGYNPAASGVAVNAPYEIIFGARTQWIGMPNNPKSGFFSFNYNFTPQHSYHNWHNVGAYIAQDQSGNFVHNDIWLSYTHHLLINRKMILSAGIFAGIKQFRLTLNNLDRNDPAVQKSASSVIALPDIVPGIRLTSKKFFVDFSLYQVSIFGQKGIGGQIGSPSPLLPHFNASAGKKAILNDFNTLMVAVNVRSSFTALPSVELNVLNYYNKRIAYGGSIRGKNFLCAIVQLRVLQTLNIGMAYDFSINKMLRASPNTAEIMISLSPIFGGEAIEKTSRRSVNECTF